MDELCAFDSEVQSLVENLEQLKFDSDNTKKVQNTSSELFKQFFRKLIMSDGLFSTLNLRNYNFLTAYTLTTIETFSHEYQKVSAHFSIRYRNIDKIQRVDNPFLFTQFLLKKEKMLKTGYSSVKEQYLFHGTHQLHIKNICQNNFNWRLINNCKFGRGVSFTPDAFYASHYTNDNLLILAVVLIGEKHLGNCLHSVPHEGFDTTTNGKDTVYVKYEDDDFYPAYIVHYS